MKKYLIQHIVEQMLYLTVEANSEEEAREKVEEAWKDNIIYGDFFYDNSPTVECIIRAEELTEDEKTWYPNLQDILDEKI